MQVGSKVVCVYAGDSTLIETHGTYEVLGFSNYDGPKSHIEIGLNGRLLGSYSPKRFMTVEEVTKQTQENLND